MIFLWYKIWKCPFFFFFYIQFFRSTLDFSALRPFAVDVDLLLIVSYLLYFSAFLYRHFYSIFAYPPKILYFHSFFFFFFTWKELKMCCAFDCSDNDLCIWPNNVKLWAGFYFFLSVMKTIKMQFLWISYWFQEGWQTCVFFSMFLDRKPAYL